MSHTDRRAFTLVELLVVIAIIGVLVALLLPAVQSARESARRTQCLNNLTQVVMAINSYQGTYGVYPAGTIDAQGPIANVPKGYHHSWVSRILPDLDRRTTYDHIDWNVGVYDPQNAPVRDVVLSVLLCPSSERGGAGYTNYAGTQHEVEAPIDDDNHGVFFLNRFVSPRDIHDGAGQTLFVGEKRILSDDLGWMSGTRATLRNTGTPLNAAGTQTRPPRGPASQQMSTIVFEINSADADSASEESTATTADGDASGQIVNGLPTGPYAVGGFGSDHPGGANFALGDGGVRYIADTIDTRVYRQLGHRADGELLNEDAY